MEDGQGAIGGDLRQMPSEDVSDADTEEVQDAISPRTGRLRRSTQHVNNNKFHANQLEPYSSI